MTARALDYAARVIWDGNTGEGTRSYTSYDRRYRALVAGKPDLAGSADPAFRGDADAYNPEDLFLTSVSACHMLLYLSLCARKGVRVLAYEDDAQGRLVLDASGGGRFEEIRLRPHVTIDDEDASTLHAHPRPAKGIAHLGQCPGPVVERDRQILHGIPPSVM